MKKIFCIILVTMLSIGAAGGFVWQRAMHADGSDITISTVDYTVKAGDEITVSVTASSADLMSYVKTTLSYDPEILEPVDMESVLANTNNEIYIIDALEENKNEKVYEVKFTALKEGKTTINMFDAYIEDAKTQELINVGDNTEELTLMVEKSEVEDVADVALAE